MPKSRSRSSATYLARRRWTEKEARQALAALGRSGLLLTTFAIQEGLSPQRLSRWRSRLGPASTPMFEEISQSEIASAVDGDAGARSAPEPFEVVLSSGRVVRVPTSFDATALGCLLAVVDQMAVCREVQQP